MNELLKILSKVFEEGKLKENGDRLKNLTDLYNLCISEGYKGNIATFESEYKKLVEQCSDVLKTSELSDFDLESISGGVNNTFKSSVAMLMTALSLSGSASSMVSAAANNSANQNSVIQGAGEWIKSKYNTISEKTSEWLKARSKNEITAMKTTGGLVGVGVASASVIALVTKNSKNYKNVQTLVSLLAHSQSYMSTSYSKKLSLIKEAYLELGLQSDQLKTINIDIQTVKNRLILAINNKIESLHKSDKKHKDIEILASFLKLMQPIQFQSNTLKVDNEQNKDNTQTYNSERNQSDIQTEDSEKIQNDSQEENSEQNSDDNYKYDNKQSQSNAQTYNSERSQSDIQTEDNEKIQNDSQEENSKKNPNDNHKYDNKQSQSNTRDKLNLQDLLKKELDQRRKNLRILSEEDDDDDSSEDEMDLNF